MHKLDRTPIQAPNCLGQFRHGTHNWDSLDFDERQEIRDSLEQFQGRRCAYCEASLDERGQHIEHFRSRGDFPTLIFTWENLFWSCDDLYHCGRFKDNGAGPYNVNDLINPADEDPEHFLRFSSDGTIRPRSGLTAAELHRANETLRVFNLDSTRGPLRYMRKNACMEYVTIGDDIAAIAQQSPLEEVKSYLEMEIAATRHLPFASAIKHTLSPF